jgi:hypothetical protein
VTERTRADELAELVCALYGWTGGVDRGTERGKALHQLWSEWLEERGNYTPRSYPQLSAQGVAELAAKRDDIRA